jgi:hypothetical protein
MRTYILMLAVSAAMTGLADCSASRCGAHTRTLRNRTALTRCSGKFTVVGRRVGRRPRLHRGIADWSRRTNQTRPLPAGRRVEWTRWMGRQ